MGLSPEEIRAWREKLEAAKERCLSRKDFPPLVIVELEGIEKDLAAYDPDFVAEILRQLAEAMGKTDGNDALRLRFARSILKRVTSGNPLEIMWVTQMIAGHGATMNVARLMNSSKTVDDIERSGNIFNKLMRTFTDQMGTMHRLHSGPEPKLMVSVNDGGQAAFVNHLTQNGGEKGKADAAEVPPLVTDQSGMAMPIVGQDNQSAAAVPRMDQDQEPAPSAKRRKRRA